MRWLIAAVLILMGFGYHQTAVLYPEAVWLQGPMARTIYPVIVLALSLALVGTSRWIKRKDPVLFSWTVLGLTGCLLIVPLLLAKNRQTHADEMEQVAMEDARKQLVADLRRRQQMQKAIEADRRERMKTDRYAQYEGQVPMDKLDALRLLDKNMHEAFQRHTDDYMAALNANPTKGPNSWIRAQSPDELDAELEAHNELYAKTRSFTRFVETFEEQYTSAIDALDLQPPADRIAVAELQRILQMWEQANAYTLRQLDISMFGEAIKALNVLKNAWGQWQFDPRTSALTFQNPDHEYAFHEAVARMREISEEVDSLQ